MGDDPELWLTYEEAAGRLQIKPDSVRRRAAARKWPRRLGNDGKARVRIPEDALPPDVKGDVTPILTPDASAELNEARVEISALKAELAGVRDRLSDTQTDRDRWRAQAELLAETRKPVIGFLGRLLGRG
jgi:predicted flap endonuclease-1-like 5' DNA nuclease